MKGINLGKRYLALILAVVLATACVSPPIHAAFLYLARIQPKLMFLTELTVDRIMSRLIGLGLLIALISRPKFFGLRSPRQMDFDFQSRWGRQLAWGAAFSMGVALLITVCLFGLGARRWDGDGNPALSHFLFRLVETLIGVVFIGFTEEYFFRGVVLQSLLRKYSTGVSVLLSSMVYSAVHFARLENYTPAAEFEPLEGFRVLGRFFDPVLTEPLRNAPAFLGLFIAGIVFANCYLYSGRLFLSTGLHAGWVFIYKMDGLFLDNPSIGSKWLYGSGKIIDGLLAQLIVVLFALAVFLLLKTRSIRPKQAWLDLPEREQTQERESGGTDQSS